MPASLPLQAMPFSIRFITIDRQPSYIHETIRSFRESDPLSAGFQPVDFMVGNTDAAYLRPYAEAGIGNVHPMTPQEFHKMETRAVPSDRRIHLRLNTNFVRALLFQADLHRPVIIFQDDLRFTTHWIGKLLIYLAGSHAALGDRFIFSLYCPFELPPDPAVYEIVPILFYGAQGLYFPAALRQEIADEVQRNGIENCLGADDMLIRDYCIKQQIPILTPRPSLIQHEGQITTGLSPDSMRCHRSPTFQP